MTSRIKCTRRCQPLRVQSMDMCFTHVHSLPVSGHVEVAKAAVKGGRLTEREERHVQALLAYSEGQLPTAINHWADILISYPRDLIAVRILFVSCKMLGLFARSRDVIAAVLPHWNKTNSLYPYLLALYNLSHTRTHFLTLAHTHTVCTYHTTCTQWHAHHIVCVHKILSVWVGMHLVWRRPTIL